MQRRAPQQSPDTLQDSPDAAHAEFRSAPPPSVGKAMSELLPPSAVSLGVSLTQLDISRAAHKIWHRSHREIIPYYSPQLA